MQMLPVGPWYQPLIANPMERSFALGARFLDCLSNLG